MGGTLLVGVQALRTMQDSLNVSSYRHRGYGLLAGDGCDRERRARERV